MEKETSPYVWQIVFNFYDAHIKNQPKELLKLAITNWLSKRMKLFLSGVSLEVNPKDTTSYNLRRRLGIQYAIEFGNSTSLTEINNIYSKFKNRGNVNPNLRSFVYSSAIADSTDDDDWLFLFDKLQKTEVLSERKMFVDALSKSRKSTLNEKLVVHLISAKPEIGNALQLLKMITSSSLITRKAILQAIQNRYRMFSKRFGDPGADNKWTEILDIAIETIMDDDEKTAFLAFLKKPLKYDDAKIAIFEKKLTLRMKSRTAITVALKAAFCD